MWKKCNITPSFVVRLWRVPRALLGWNPWCRRQLWLQTGPWDWTYLPGDNDVKHLYIFLGCSHLNVFRANENTEALRWDLCKRKAQRDWADVNIFVRIFLKLALYFFLILCFQFGSPTANIVEATARFTLMDQIGLLGNICIRVVISTRIGTFNELITL